MAVRRLESVKLVIILSELTVLILGGDKGRPSAIDSMRKSPFYLVVGWYRQSQRVVSLDQEPLSSKMCPVFSPDWSMFIQWHYIV